MLTSAFAAAVGAWATGDPLIGLLIAIVAVQPVALLQAMLSNSLRANQIVSGIGINILVLGATTLAYREIFGARSRAEIPGLAKVKPPLLGDIPVIGSAVFEQVWLLYAGIALIVATALVLRYTSIGLAIHAAGAEPRAVDKSGLSVTRVRHAMPILTMALLKSSPSARHSYRAARMLGADRSSNPIGWRLAVAQIGVRTPTRCRCSGEQLPSNRGPLHGQ